MKKVVISILSVVIMSSVVYAAVDFLEHKQVKIGEPVADFELKDMTGKMHKLSDYKGGIVMIHFWSATCPFVLRYDEALKKITSDYQPTGVVVLAIDSNKSEDVEEIKKVAEERKINYPVLIDTGNKIADQFGAITTPHVFIVDPNGNLAYEGAVDDQGWSETNQPKKFYAREALDQVLKSEKVTTPQTKSVGCTVKRA